MTRPISWKTLTTRTQKQSRTSSRWWGTWTSSGSNTLWTILSVLSIRPRSRASRWCWFHLTTSRWPCSSRMSLAKRISTGAALSPRVPRRICWSEITLICLNLSSKGSRIRSIEESYRGRNLKASISATIKNRPKRRNSRQWRRPHRNVARSTRISALLIASYTSTKTNICERMEMCVTTKTSRLAQCQSPWCLGTISRRAQCRKARERGRRTTRAKSY